MRDLPHAYRQHLVNPSSRPVLFLQADYPDGMVRVSTLTRSIVVGGYLWQGLGALGLMSDIEVSGEARSTGWAFGLSGIPINLAHYLRSQDVFGRRVTLSRGFMASRGEFDADAGLQVLYWGTMVLQSLRIDSNIELRVDCEDVDTDWERFAARRLTHVDQTARYPADLGLEFLAAQKNLEISQ